MIRRSFRVGLTLGLLCGAVLALVKILGGRPGQSAPVPAPAQPWPPLEPDVPPASATASGTTHATASPPPSTGPQGATAPQATHPRRPDSAVSPAPGSAGRGDEGRVAATADPGAPRPARRAKKAPLKAAPAPARQATAKGAAGKGPAKKVAKKSSAATSWVEPSGDVCPTSHPVKAKMSSKIFHVPGMLNYLRTRPDRCYADAAAAEADGLRPAKR